MYKALIDFIKSQYPEQGGIPLHAPSFLGNEKAYVMDCIDSTFVSSVGQYVNRFEEAMAEYTGARYAIAVTNGTAALHLAFRLAGVTQGTDVLTQPLSFVATCNAIQYLGAHPAFIDVDRDTLGLSIEKLKRFLESNTKQENGACINLQTGRKISACVPMHTFGFCGAVDELVTLCEAHNIPVVEDAAEALGAKYKGKHLGTFGKLGAFSFNGNKIITAGGGGVIVTDDEELAAQAKHLSTTAKQPHAWEYVHDALAYNYRMPNLNAALVLAQLEQLDGFLANKAKLAQKYTAFFKAESLGIDFFPCPEDNQPNNWLNTVVVQDRKQRDELLGALNEAKVFARPIWTLLSKLDHFKDSFVGDISNAEWLEDRLVNLPSSITT